MWRRKIRGSRESELAGAVDKNGNDEIKVPTTAVGRLPWHRWLCSGTPTACNQYEATATETFSRASFVAHLTFTERPNTDSPRCNGTDKALRTRPCTLVAPHQGSTSDQLVHSTGLDHAAIPPHGSIVPRCPAPASSPTSTTVRESSTRLVVSPIGAANIRVRRPNPWQALLRSPARAGYTSCMRQLFEDANHGQFDLQSNPTLLYPQLPNISRTAAPTVAKLTGTDSPRLRNKPHVPQNYRPESLCLSTELLSAVAPTIKTNPYCLSASQCSPGSWSDDSGYIIARSRDHPQCSAIPLSERIYGWLCDLPDDGRENDRLHGCRDERQLNPAVVEQIEGTYNVLGNTSRNYLFEASSTLEAQSPNIVSVARLSPTLDDPVENSAKSGRSLITPVMAGRTLRYKIPQSMVPGNSHQAYSKSQGESIDCSSKYNHDVSKMEDDGNEANDAEEVDNQLSPLSPNVCIERGPSRYHSNRRLRDDDIVSTPCREHHTAHLYLPKLKENAVMQISKGGNGHSPPVMG
ncbi:hypothetical protein DE146DRAFT_630593 [Phaeosphaeria sp. MPI-PUGE-AT-0046c]|nr:hypothetical protein DE146DRAFT_630593 [Phaeosphaeria sp. MPI-PUGE-AT-0046c]